MDILFFGGAFDPPHTGHSHILNRALNYKTFDKIIIMPTGTPGHKSGCKAPFPIRKLMAQKAFDYPGLNVEFSDYEGLRDEKSYSYITVDHLREQYPTAKIWFLIGADSAINMKSWVNWQRLASQTAFIILDRGRQDSTALKNAVEEIKNYSPDSIVLKAWPVEQSSTQIRRLAQKGADISERVCPQVQDIIIKAALYDEDYYKRNISTARFLLPLMMDEKRQRHTLNVRRLAVKLALKHEADLDKTQLCALLHDVMKQAPRREILRRAGAFLGRETARKKSPEVLHGFAAAHFAQREMSIDDDETLWALRSHTCARPNMSDVEKILYLADMLSAERKFDGKQRLLDAAYDNLDTAMEKALESSLAWLKEKNRQTDPDSLLALDYFKKLNKDGGSIDGK